jgi:AcrR family transcriptional regulator
MEVYGVDKGANPTATRIAAAAREILTSEGAGAVSMRRVAQAVGLTPMAIYRHFANREVLLRQVADATFREIADTWAEKTHRGPVEERLHAALDDYLDFALREPKLYEFLFGERREDARMFPDDFRARRSPTLNVLVEQLTEGMRTGLFRIDDVWEVAIAVAALLHGFVQLYHGGRIGLSDDDFRALCHASTRRLFDGIKA